MPLPSRTLLLHAALTLSAMALVLPAGAATPEDAGADDMPATPMQAVQPPLILSPDGSLVIDTRARLAWPRCVEGMRWSGNGCTGVPQLLRLNELRRLANRKALPPSVDTQLFPAMPRDWLWTGTASVNTNTVNPYAYGNVARGGAGESSMTVQQSWAVDMASGQARGDVGRGTRLVVRLVRPAP